MLQIKEDNVNIRTRRLITLFVSMFLGIVFAVLMLKSGALAADVRPYTKIGGMELIENGISEGHKVFYRRS